MTYSILNKLIFFVNFLYCYHCLKAPCQIGSISKIQSAKSLENESRTSFTLAKIVGNHFESFASFNIDNPICFSGNIHAFIQFVKFAKYSLGPSSQQLLMKFNNPPTRFNLSKLHFIIILSLFFS